MSGKKRFREFEETHSVFDLEVNGVRIWERLRLKVYRRIKEKSGIGQAHTSIDFDRSDHLKGAKLWLRNIFLNNPYLASPSDIVFMGHHRRKKEPDGLWWDIYCDPIHEYCSLDSTHFESPYLLDHRTPAKTDSLRYLELIQYTGTIQRKLGLHDVTISTEKKNRLDTIEKELQKEFGIYFQVTENVRHLLHNRSCRLWLYKSLLNRVDPNLAVVVVSYGKHLFIEACKEKNIPVVELQHGLIHPDHLGYAFSGDRTKTLFPDYLLTWGEFWGKNVEFPIPDDRVFPVGYPYLEQSWKRYDEISERQQILFISQGTIGKELSKFAINVNRHPEIPHDVVYKLHPGEYNRWRNEYPWLLDVDFEIVDSSEPPLYELFAESSVQVGVCSTAIYEGLSFDLETYLYDCQGTSRLEPLLEAGSAELISSATDLTHSIGTQRKSFESDYYFAPNATETMCEILNRLTNEATPFSRGFVDSADHK